MARYRVNPNAVCSSKDYKKSKKLHIKFLRENHKIFLEMVDKEEIVIKKKAYIKCFGRLVPVSPEEVIKLKETIQIIWK